MRPRPVLPSTRVASPIRNTPGTPRAAEFTIVTSTPGAIRTVPSFLSTSVVKPKISLLLHFQFIGHLTFDKIEEDMAGTIFRIFQYFLLKRDGGFDTAYNRLVQGTF